MLNWERRNIWCWNLERCEI